MNIRHYITIIAITATTSVIAQQKYTSPVDFSITLTGNFGEIRNEHFHTGIDIKALKGEGSAITSIADGYVSRIGVSPWGYGNVLYITHLDGRVSVYGHLQKFVPAIEKWVLSQQISKQTFTVNLYPNADKFAVKQGEHIAYMGNSGSSGGAHLHFEIRESGTGNPINIISHGIYTVSDHVKPTLKSIKLFEIDTVNGIAVHTLKQSKSPNDTTPLKLRDRGYIAYEVIDYKDGKSNTMGTYSIEQEVNGVVNFGFKLDEINFNTSKYIKTFTAFKEDRESKIDVIRAYTSANNLLKCYNNVKNRGIVTASDTPIKVVTKITDDAGNKTSISFNIIKDSSRSQISIPENSQPVRWNKQFTHIGEKIAATISSGTMYDDCYIKFEEQNDIYIIGDRNTPIHKPIAITLAVPNNTKINKIGMVEVNEKGHTSNWHDVKYQNGKISTKIKRLGNYKIANDTIKPTINTLSTVTKGGRDLKFRLSDNLSGIADYSLTVDGEWVLSSYDGKTATLTHQIKRAKTPVIHKVSVSVIDAAGNRNTIKKDLEW